MSGFEQLSGAITAPPVAITAEETAFEGETLSDESALSVVLRDVDAAITYRQSKGLSTDWDMDDDLFRGYVKPKTWPGSDVPRANLSMHLVLEVIEKLMPELYLAFFSSSRPFTLQPKGKTTPEAAEARCKVLDWALEQSDFKEEMRRMLKSCLQYGFCIGHYGWKSCSKPVKVYHRKSQPVSVDAGISQIKVNTVESDEIEVKKDYIDINVPTFENVELRNVLLDPKLSQQDCRKGRYVIFQTFIMADDLQDLAETDGYKDVPTKEELREILSAKAEPTTDSLVGQKTNSWRDLQAEPVALGYDSADPLKQPLELLEYWSDCRVITVLQKKIVIRNEEHEFDIVPFNSCAFIDVLGSAYGFGIAKLLSGEQRFETGVVNSWIDQLALVLTPVFQLQKGVGSGTQNVKFSPGKIITEAGELKPISVVSTDATALNAIQTSEARANRRVGSNGGSDMPNQAMRTSAGVQAFQTDVTNRLAYFIDIFSNLVFVPVLEKFIELCNDHLKPSQINQILSDEDGKAYEGDLLDVYNATTSVDVLATTQLAARKAAANMIPMLVQLLSSQPVQDSLSQQGKKFNYAEMIEEGLELNGWNADSLIVDMTPEDQQRAQMMNPAAVKAQGDAQKQQMVTQGNLQAIEAKGTAQAGVQIVKHLLDGAKDSTALENLLTQQQIQQGAQGGPQGA